MTAQIRVGFGICFLGFFQIFSENLDLKKSKKILKSQSCSEVLREYSQEFMLEILFKFNCSNAFIFRDVTFVMSFFKCSKNLKFFFFNFEVSLSIVGLCQRSLVVS